MAAPKDVPVGGVYLVLVIHRYPRAKLLRFILLAAPVLKWKLIPPSTL
jgi:hypothetical protein